MEEHAVVSRYKCSCKKYIRAVKYFPKDHYASHGHVEMYDSGKTSFRPQPISWAEFDLELGPTRRERPIFFLSNAHLSFACNFFIVVDKLGKEFSAISG